MRTLSISLCVVLASSFTASGQDSQLVAKDAKLRTLATEFQFTEGPIADPQGNVYFTDQPNDRIMKWSVDGKLSTFLQPAGRPNGLYFDINGSLLAAADERNEVWSIDAQGKHTVLVDKYQGKLLNGPNDLWVRPDGGLYFTDPYYKRDYWKRGGIEQNVRGVYFLDKDRKTLTRVVDWMKQPNGLIGTPDGKSLYVADLNGKQTYALQISADGSLSNKKLFCEMGSDGMTLDEQGNVYLTGNGVTIFNRDGKQIHQIAIPQGWTSNVCFGGSDFKTLFVTAGTSIYSIPMQVAGAR